MRLAELPTIDGNKDIVEAYEYNEFPFDKLNTDTFKSRKKKSKVKTICCTFGTFDIETTTILPSNVDEKPFGFMYHWQMCIGGIDVYGRYWKDWITFLKNLCNYFKVSPENHFIIYVHNLGYEQQFMTPYLIEAFGDAEIFASNPRKPMKLTCANGLEFRCSYFLSNMSLYKATTNELGVIHIKAKGDLDYKKLRIPSTYLDDTEFAYCIGDTHSLYEYIVKKLENENDTLDSIPMTSTGYVRRDCRKATKKDNKYRIKFLKMRLNEKTYTLLKEASRGGNTHACRWFSNKILENVYSFDVNSSYPAQMLLKKFPCTKFFEYGTLNNLNELNEVCEEYCAIFRVFFKGLKLKERVAIPYIPLAKAIERPKNAKNDNGRILYADSFAMTITNVDWEIIKSQYTWDSIAISDLYVARKDYLPQVLRDKVMEYYKAKCELKEQINAVKEKLKGQPNDAQLKEELSNLNYLYMKQKNRLNGIFGMAYTDICPTTTTFENGEWREEKGDIAEAIEKYYSSMNSFLYFAWGCFITAEARSWLEVLLNNSGEVIYCDTDSSKCLEPDLNKINELNKNIEKLCIERGAYCDVNGHRYFLGTYENETPTPYEKFKALGAKKYAYVEDGEFHITISGVNKSLGAEEMKTIDNFRIGFIFNKSAGSTLYYNDEQTIHDITINGETFSTASNIGMIDSTYKIGITDEYAEVLDQYLEVV